jgi:hypothetical protein
VQSSSPRPVFEASKYALETLRKDGELVLYRGKSKEDRSQVLLLSPAGQHPSPEIRRLRSRTADISILKPSLTIPNSSALRKYEATFAL